jgi:hypothetical protein
VAPDLEATRRRCRSLHFDHGSVVVTQGFVARGPRAEPLLLGRGGSDTTATLLGAALEAEEVAILTDVEGVASADPRVVPEARCLGRLGWAEAEELATWGQRCSTPRRWRPPLKVACRCASPMPRRRMPMAPESAARERRCGRCWRDGGWIWCAWQGAGVGFEAHAGLVREAEAADARVVAWPGRTGR